MRFVPFGSVQAGVLGDGAAAAVAVAVEPRWRWGWCQLLSARVVGAEALGLVVEDPAAPRMAELGGDCLMDPVVTLRW